MNLSKYFTIDTLNYLESSFKKANLEKQDVKGLFDWLSHPPKWTTIRVNTNLAVDLNKSLQDVQDFVDSSFESLNNLLEEENKINSIPKCSFLNDLIRECIIFNCSDLQTEPIQNNLKKSNKIVIIDLKCAQAVLRGADIFVPGILSLSLGCKAKDEVSIYADLTGKCLKGSDSNLYLFNNSDSVYFIGNGWVMYDRDDIFKNLNTPKSGVGIKIKRLYNNTYVPSFDRLNDSLFYPQNLPSIICAKVLDPQEGELILDMCAAPGGKTTHLAQLVNNKSRILAFDKISSKIVKMKELCNKLNANCVECFCQDATKIDFNIYKPESFDRILVDAPCSALGQRPLIFNNISVNQLNSYIKYQKMILDNAVKLLKPGGTLVYSTCTITLEENEEQVSWLLNKYQNFKLVNQDPFLFASSKGLTCSGLDQDQLNLLQRFMPSNLVNPSSNSVYEDTNVFFIAKFLKI